MEYIARERARESKKKIKRDDSQVYYIVMDVSIPLG
jgi:hypothetical protein